MAILGDILHSRVARSNIDSFSRLGAKVKVAAPPTLLPPGLDGLGAQVVADPAAAVADADVIYVSNVNGRPKVTWLR